MANTIVFINNLNWFHPLPETGGVGLTMVVLCEGCTVATTNNFVVPFALTYAQVMDIIRTTAIQIAADLGFPFSGSDTMQIFNGPQATLADLSG
jgi:hypothetical protein